MLLQYIFRMEGQSAFGSGRNRANTFGHEGSDTDRCATITGQV